MIGLKNTRKNGRSKIPKIMNPIVLKTDVQQCLFLSSNALFSPKRVTPQLVSEKYPKWFAQADASSPQFEQQMNWQKWHLWTMLTFYLALAGLSPRLREQHNGQNETAAFTSSSTAASRQFLLLATGGLGLGLDFGLGFGFGFFLPPPFASSSSFFSSSISFSACSSTYGSSRTTSTYGYISSMTLIGASSQSTSPCHKRLHQQQISMQHLLHLISLVYRSYALTTFPQFGRMHWMHSGSL